MSTEVLDQIRAAGVLPVIVIDDAKKAVLLADALLRGGMAVAEITFRTAAAADVIAAMKQARPSMLIGAGTVLNGATVDAARSAGADFALAPGSNPQVIRHAADVGLPFYPGVTAPSDIEAALSAGARVLKFFPAEASGGLDWLKVVASPYVMEGLRFIPTGGIRRDTAGRYLASPLVLAVGGTWIAEQEMIARGDWDAVSANAAEAVQLATQAHAENP